MTQEEQAQIIDRYKFGYCSTNVIYKVRTQAIYCENPRESPIRDKKLVTILLLIALALILLLTLGSAKIMVAFLVPLIASCFSRIYFSR